MILLMEFHQHGERADAGTAPRCPEVEQDILPLTCIFGQAMHSAVWQLGLEVDERLADDGQLRLWLKVEFPPFLVYLVPCKYRDNSKHKNKQRVENDLHYLSENPLHLFTLYFHWS